MEKIKKGYVVQILLKEQLVPILLNHLERVEDVHILLEERLVPIRVYARDEEFIDKWLSGKNQIQIIWNEKGEIIWQKH